MKRFFLLILFALPLCLLSCAGVGAGHSVTDGNSAADTDSPETGRSETEGNSATSDKTEIGDDTSLCRVWSDDFPIGVALPNIVFADWNKYGTFVTDNFSSFTCENEMKPDYILDRDATVADTRANYTSPKVKFDVSAPAVKTAVKAGVKMRIHTLVWHAQTPAWFFTEDYTDTGALVSREVMLARMESYIKSVLTYYDENYPGLIYAVDVVNEAFDPGTGDENGVRRENNKWYDTIGADYVYWAFYYARKYAPEYMKLFYNDYSCMYKVDVILDNLARVKSEGLIYGIGMQSHIDINTSVSGFADAVRRFCDAGYEVQLTELDIGVPAATDENFAAQGEYYERFMRKIAELRRSGYNITSVTVWGLSDGLTWRPNDFPLLLDRDLKPKPAFYGFIAGGAF